MLFQACVLALAVSSTFAIDCSNPGCQEQWWDAAPRDLPSEICQAGKDWRNCLDAFLMIGCSFEDGFDVFYTQELNSADQYCSMEDPDDTTCDAINDCSKQAEIDCSTSQTERCDLAHEWRYCLEGFIGTCTVDFPIELNIAEAFACYNSGGDAVAAEDTCGASGGDATEAPETEAPETTTEAPETEAPETEAPETEAPETEAPETEAPETTTEAPETEAPETEAPETEAPETEAPETEAPETEAPETEAPETEAPETEAPETEAPETEAPETEAPETEAPETEAPETEAPETEAPTETEAPETEAPETEAPETEAPEEEEEDLSDECEAALLDCETSYKVLVESSGDETMACAMALGWNGCIDLTVQYGCPADVHQAEKDARASDYCGEEN